MKDWKTVRLGDICEILNGYAFDSKLFNSNNNGTPLVRIRDVVRGFSETYTTELADDKFLVRKGDLLIGMDGEFNCSPWNSEPSYLNQRVCKLCFIADSYDKKYVFYSLHKKLKEIEDKTAFVTVKHISSKQISDIAIINRPLNEQRHIAFVLEKCTELITKYKRMLEKYDALIKSRFIEMFGDPVKNIKGWKTESLQQVAPAKPAKNNLNDKVWLLNLDMVESQTGKVIDYLYVNISDTGNSTYQFDEGNVLYSKLRPYLNKVVIPEQPGICTSELVPLRPTEKLNRYFLANLLRTDFFVNFINEKVAGAKMPRVSMDTFRAFDCILPPIELQNDFAAFVQQIDKSKFEYKTKEIAA